MKTQSIPRAMSLAILTAILSALSAVPAAASGEKPTVSQLTWSDQDSTTATVSAVINPNGLNTTYKFEYREVTTYPFADFLPMPVWPKSIGSGTSNVGVSEELRGLQPGKEHDLRIVAKNSKGTTFTERVVVPVKTNYARGVGETTATLRGVINPEELETEYWFEYGTSPGEYTDYLPLYEEEEFAESEEKAPAPVSIGSGDENVVVSQDLDHLQPYTAYYYRLVASNEEGIRASEERKFTTGAGAVTFAEEGMPLEPGTKILGESNNLEVNFSVGTGACPKATFVAEVASNGTSPSGIAMLEPLAFDCVFFTEGGNLDSEFYNVEISPVDFFSDSSSGPEEFTSGGYTDGTVTIESISGTFKSPFGATCHLNGEEPIELSNSWSSDYGPKWLMRWVFETLGGGCAPVLLAGDFKLTLEDETPIEISAEEFWDERPPETKITKGTAGIVQPAEVEFEFETDDPSAAFECAVDSEPFTSEWCVSPKHYSPAQGTEHLPDGPHVFRVRAVDESGNRDPSPAERAFHVDKAPEIVITSPKPSYTAGETWPVTFWTDEEDASLACSLDGAGYESCTSPFTLPSKLDTDWHTFKVRATDAAENVSVAEWTFKTLPYPAAPSTSKLISPEEGRKSASHFTLGSEWGSPPEGGGVSSVSYQLKHPSWDAFKAIPAEYLRDDKGDEPGWSLPVAKNPDKSPPLFFDVKSYAEAEEWGPIVDDLKLRAVFNGGKNAAGASEPVTVGYSRFGGGSADATAGVGPANVNLLTGAFTMSRTDVSIPVPGTEANLEFTRTYNSAYGAFEATNSKTLGQMWQPSAPVEAEYEEEAWQKLLVKHEPYVPAKYDAECVQEWEEWKDFDKEECLEEYEILEANWVEVLDNEGAGIPFDRVGAKAPFSYPSPEDAKDYRLTKSESNFILADANGTSTEFSPNGSTGEYVPTKVSFAGSAKQSRLTYGISEGKMRLLSVIAPASAGVTCNPFEGEGGNYAPKTAGCRSLFFTYINFSIEGGPSEQRLERITYYDSSGSGTGHVVSRYSYDSASGNLVAQWDPRVHPGPEEPLKERYAYESTKDARLTRMTPAGEEPWDFTYYGAGSGGAYEAKLKSVNRASLLESPEIAKTTIAYDVPVSGEGAPYDMSLASIAEWAQSDYPVDAAAIFGPDQIPSDPPSDYTRATVHYIDPDGNQVNTAATAPPGVEGKAITTSEVDAKGNVVRELSAGNRLEALAAGPQSAARAKELDTHSTYNADGTRMLESFGPLHEVRLENGQTVKARQHTTISYDEGAPTPKEDETWPNLPTKESVGARIPGQGSDKDVRVSETKYDWDLRKPTEQITDPGGLNLITKTVYNAAGQVIESRQPSDVAGEDAGTTVNAYYSAGTQSPITACRNKPQWAGLSCVSYPKAEPSPEAGNPKLPWTWITSYNTLDTPTEIQEKVDGELKRTTTTTYDAAGRPVQSHETGEGVETPPSETLYSETTGAPVAQRLVCAEECEGFDNQEVKTTFDTLGRPIAYEDADGNVSGTAYDLLGRPVITSDGKGTQTATYDANSGVLTQMTDSQAGTFTASYDADGKVLETALPNGIVAQPDYDAAGTQTALDYTQSYCAEECTWLSFQRESSIHGQVLYQKATIEGVLSSQAYTYDAAGRLTLAKDTEAGQCTTRAYTFDKNTNRTKLVTRAPKEGGACDTTSEGTTKNYSYDTADRLIGEGVVTYDNLGQITALAASFAGGELLQATYYTNGMVRANQQGGGVTNYYDLDATGRQRSRKRSSGSEGWNTEIYHYAGSSDSPAWIDKGEKGWTRSISGIGGNLGAVYDSVTGGVVFQLSDPHGDIVATASAGPIEEEEEFHFSEESQHSGGVILSTQSFDEYGNPKQQSDARFGWLGAMQRRTELPSGVIQMGVRSYVPALGRFLSVDPIPGGSANAYEYGAGDPVNNFDLTGEHCTSKKACANAIKRRKKKVRRQIRRVRALVRQHTRESARSSSSQALRVPTLTETLFSSIKKAKSTLQKVEEATSCELGSFAAGVGSEYVRKRGNKLQESVSRIGRAVGKLANRLGALGTALSGASLVGLC